MCRFGVCGYFCKEERGLSQSLQGLVMGAEILRVPTGCMVTVLCSGHSHPPLTEDTGLREVKVHPQVDMGRDGAEFCWSS